MHETRSSTSKYLSCKAVSIALGHLTHLISSQLRAGTPLDPHGQWKAIIGCQRSMAALNTLGQLQETGHLSCMPYSVERGKSHLWHDAVWTAPHNGKDKLQHDSEILARRMTLLVQHSHKVGLHELQDAFLKQISSPLATSLSSKCLSAQYNMRFRACCFCIVDIQGQSSRHCC